MKNTIASLIVAATAVIAVPSVAHAIDEPPTPEQCVAQINDLTTTIEYLNRELLGTYQESDRLATLARRREGRLAKKNEEIARLKKEIRRLRNQ